MPKILKLIIFLAVLIAVSIADIISIRRKGLGNEIIPYILITAAAAAAGAAVFTAPMHGSILRAAFKLFGAE